jgi:molybdenum cofactor cytidylyltransferase
MIWAVILAAGMSRRMGKTKLLLPFGKKTIIETVVQSVVSSRVDGTLVVLGSEQEKIEEKVRNFPVRSVFNPDFRSGMLSSVLCGIKALPVETRAVVIVLGDQPSVSKQTIDRIVDEYQKTGKGIVLPVYNKERGHPVLIDMKYREEVEALSPDIGLRGTVYSHPEDILEVDVDMPSILQDIDDETDYKKELENKEKIGSED